MAEETLLDQHDVKPDDSCITEYIEIIPLARECNELDYCDEVKQELLQDIKQEPPYDLHEVCDTKDICTAAEVRLRLCICMC